MFDFHSVEDFLGKEEISSVRETHCSSFDCVENLDESITSGISGNVTPKFVVESEVDLMCADKHNKLFFGRVPVVCHRARE